MQSKKVINTVNPFTEKIIKSYEYFTDQKVQDIVSDSHHAFKNWRNLDVSERIEYFKNLSRVVEERKSELSRLATIEMGKPLSQSKAEVEKCIWLIDYYSENAEKFLAPQEIETDAKESIVNYDPLGIILAIMPWNFPYWQVFRFMVPTLIAGNTCLVKHAPNTFGCAESIQELMNEAGFPDGIYTNLIVDVNQVENILEDQRVKAITLTGSSSAGSSVASIAGKNIKKSVLELGGSNAFIVLKDADLESAIKTAAQARLQNNGQSCIAAKRFLVEDEVFDEFLEGLKSEFQNYKMGDPSNLDTNIGPLARKDLCDLLEKQVKNSIDEGAEVFYGGSKDGNFFEPTILKTDSTDITAFREEIFGPVATCYPIKNLDEAILISNSSEYGLGVSVFTKNIELISDRLNDFEDGAVFVNQLVKSDPRLPFGGTKKSGFGRELGEHGILEFVNIKTYAIF